ncbi:ROK family protein [Paenibacillus sp. MMS20-IR301]|uniref:ROK family protein n=1 Tax=Paenibacillus sp. MMS20-IR301 TaxID=2895946 RepID=UPI0028E75DD2|nr:ROK family protein [Paenibacillus sp. MMS20-IR301]WNS45268.1 ROK family protein [Paenibacillus sp. MMS20-IR301]
MKIANANLMKEMNMNLVRLVMKQAETATKPQLAALTRLSVVTINSLAKELLERGEIYENQVVASNGGRPALTYSYNYNFRQALVICLKEQGGERFASAIVVNLGNRAVAKQEYILPAYDRQFFREIVHQFMGSHPDIQMIGLGIPGQTVDGTIVVSSHEELQGTSIVTEIGHESGLPVIVENDVNAAIIGYAAREKTAEAGEAVAGIYFPGKYPPGMGIYLDGRIIKGRNGMAGEIKFLPLAADWYTELAPSAFMHAACQIIQSVNAVLAPDKIVIYQKFVGEAEWTPFWERYRMEQPMPQYPEILLLDSFQEDYEAGMRQLILNQLDPAVTGYTAQVL